MSKTHPVFKYKEPRYVIVDFCDHDFSRVLTLTLRSYKTSPSILSRERFARQLVNGMLHEQWMWDKDMGRLDTHNEVNLRAYFLENMRVTYSDTPPDWDQDYGSRYIDRLTGLVHPF